VAAVSWLGIVLGALAARPSPAAAQEDTVSQAVMQGTVYDTISGSPVPYVIVKVAGVGTTTLTDREGRFRIMVPTDSAQLEFRRLGYYMRAVTVVAIGPAIDGDVFLRPIPVELEEIVVAGEAEDPAVRIMREAIARKKDLLSRIHDYRYDAYIKFLIRDLAKHEDSTEAVVLITETRTAAYWEQPDRYQEAIVARRQSSNLDAENNLVTVGQIVNFNRTTITSSIPSRWAAGSCSGSPSNPSPERSPSSWA
jgi:hypothetical protein